MSMIYRRPEYADSVLSRPVYALHSGLNATTVEVIAHAAV